MKLDWAYAEKIVNSNMPPFVFAIRESQTHPIRLLHKMDQDRDRGIIVSGRQMRDWDELSQTVSETFSFPFFGDNWDAMDDCLSDLSWFKFQKLLLVITQAEEVLIRQPNEFETFVSVLEQASRFWVDPVAARPFGPEDKPRIIHTVFVFPEDYKGARGLELLRS